MTRDEFLRRLGRGLADLPPEAVASILSDYEGYFADGFQAGRSEGDLALALGDPRRLADELRLDVNARSWQSDRTLRTGVRTAAGALGLVVADVLSLLPLGIAVLLCVAGLLAASVVSLAGLFVLVSAPFDEPIGGPAAAILQGVGLMAGGAAGVAAFMLASLRLLDALSWYVRIHRRVLRPILPRALARSGQAS